MHFNPPIVKICFLKSVVLIFLFCYTCFSQINLKAEEEEYYKNKHYTILKGEQESDYPRGVYLVTENVVIKEGKTMTFMPGALVLFKKDTRMTVKGRLICKGSPSATITFARLANDKYFIPLDSNVDARWDGIFVSDSGNVELSFCNINGSKYGIEATASYRGIMVIDTVMFVDNKFQNLKIGNTVIDIPEKHYVFFSSLKFNPNKPEESYKVVSSNYVPPKKVYKWKKPVQFTCGGVALAGLAAYGVCSYMAYDYQNKSNKASNPQEANDYYNKGKTMANIGNAGLIVGILGTIGFSVMFFF
jgi:hypothetical protein